MKEKEDVVWCRRAWTNPVRKRRLVRFVGAQKGRWKKTWKEEEDVKCNMTSVVTRERNILKEKNWRGNKNRKKDDQAALVINGPIVTLRRGLIDSSDVMIAKTVVAHWFAFRKMTAYMTPFCIQNASLLPTKLKSIDKRSLCMVR